MFTLKRHNDPKQYRIGPSLSAERSQRASNSQVATEEQNQFATPTRHMVDIGNLPHAARLAKAYYC